MNTKQVEEQHAKTLADFEQWKTRGGCKLTAEEIIFLCVLFKNRLPEGDLRYFVFDEPNAFLRNGKRSPRFRGS